MNKPLVYVDQNVLGAGLASRLAIDAFQWVYSTEHFAEIHRSSNPDQYLSELDKLDAKLIDLDLIDWKITGSAKIVDGPTAFQNYSNYCKAQADVDVNESLFDPLQVWANGGGSEQLLRDLSGDFSEQILMLAESLPWDQRSMLIHAVSETDLTPMIEKMIGWGNDINKTREALGGSKGRIGHITGDNQLMQIWALISPAFGNITPDQFFGFDPIHKQGHEAWPIYLGIISCCSVLDIIGFQAEKKCRKVEKIPNVRSDARHIAMGAFCTAIVSGDKRLTQRAKAIYAYKRIGTASIHLQVSAQGHAEDA